MAACTILENNNNKFWGMLLPYENKMNTIVRVKWGLNDEEHENIL